MSKDIVIRLSSKAGRSRFTLPATATYSDLQEKVKDSTGVAPELQRLALDDKGTRLVTSAQKTSLATLNIVNGSQLWLVNDDANIAAQVLTPVKISVDEEKVVPKTDAPGSSNSTATSSTSNSTAPTPAPKSADKDLAKKPQDGSTWSDKADRKAPFECFDTFLRKTGYGTHALPGNHVYASARLKAGGQIKLPPSVSIKQQPYRHVDSVSIYNKDEVQNFISYWVGDMAIQRCAWMYGYYIEDPNYGEKDMGDGTKVVVEALYEPPQEPDLLGELSVPREDDPDLPAVNRIAETLGLECVGWMFTAFGLSDDLLLSPNEVHRIARLQEQHSTSIHFTGYRLSKFVSCSVRPDPASPTLPVLNTYMVSDQCVAMVRDGMIVPNADRLNCIVREPEKNELLPDFLVESKPNKVINTDFFIIRLVDANPKKLPKFMFTHADFPRENRPGKMQQRDDLKKYCRKRSSSEASWSKYADFHFLLYVSKAIDIDTALVLCEAVRDRKEVSDGIKTLIEALVA